MIAICALGWNKATFTANWLRSLARNCGGHEVELFLMDNGSTDNGETSRLMMSARPKYFQRNENNESIHKGWNDLARRGISAGADIIIISNNDLIVGPGWLDPVVRELRPGVKRYFLPYGDVPADDAAMRATAIANAGKTSRADAGWCMMFHREAIQHWMPIPEELQLWYGDNWIHTKLREQGYTCESLWDCCVHHYTSTSCAARDGFAEIVAKDREIYNRLTGQNL